MLVIGFCVLFQFGQTEFEDEEQEEYWQKEEPCSDNEVIMSDVHMIDSEENDEINAPGAPPNPIVDHKEPNSVHACAHEHEVPSESHVQLASAVPGTAAVVTETREQILPCPALGDCALYAFIGALLCPVTHDEIEFNARMLRLFNIPLPPGPGWPWEPPSSPPAIPVFTTQWVAGELSFRQFLHEYHSLQMEVTPSTSMWLMHGSNPLDPGDGNDLAPVPQPRYRAAVQFCSDLVLYLRETLSLYRRTRQEMWVTLPEIGPHAMSDPAEHARAYREMKTPRKSLSQESVSCLASLFGVSLTIRFWVNLQGADPIHRASLSQSDVDFRQTFPSISEGWTDAHATLGRAAISIKIYFVSFSRSEDAGALPNHFEGIIDVPQRAQPTASSSSASPHGLPLAQSHLQHGESDSTPIAMPFASINVTASAVTVTAQSPIHTGIPAHMGATCSSLSFAAVIDTATPLVTRQHEDIDRDPLPTTAAAGPKPRRRHQFRPSDVLFLLELKEQRVTPSLHNRDVFQLVAEQINATHVGDGQPPCGAHNIRDWLTYNSKFTMAQARERNDQKMRSESYRSIGMRDSNQSAAEADTTSNARAFSAQELFTLNTVALQGVRGTHAFDDRLAELALEFSKSHPCSVEHVARWFRTHSSRIQKEGVVTSRSRRAFTPAEVTVLTNAVLEGATGRTECTPLLTRMALDFSVRDPCTIAQLISWMKKNSRALLLQQAAQTSAQPHPQPPLADVDAAMTTTPAAAAATCTSRTSDSVERAHQRRFSLQEQTLLEEAFDKGMTNHSMYSDTVRQLSDYFTRMSSASNPCGVQKVRNWITGRLRKQHIGLPPRPLPQSALFSQPTRLLTLQDAGICVVPSATRAPCRRFTPPELSRLRELKFTGIVGSIRHAATFESIADEFSSSSGLDTTADSVFQWFKRHAPPIATAAGTSGSERLPLRQHKQRSPAYVFTQDQLALLNEALSLGVTHLHHSEVEALVATLSTGEGVRPCTTATVLRWFEERNSLERQCGTSHSPSSQPADQIARSRSQRRFTDAETTYLQDLLSKGVSGKVQQMDIFKDIAGKFSRRGPCSAMQVLKWFRLHRIENASSIIEIITSPSQLPPFVERALPRHASRVAGRNKAKGEAVPFNHATVIDDALTHFWNGSGLWRYHDFRQTLARGELPTAERRRSALAAEVMPPVSDTVRTRCISEYNQYMDPHTPLLLCASCGVYEFNSILVPLENRHHSRDHKSLHLAIPICVNEVLYYTILRLKPDQVSEYLNRPPLYRDCYSVMRVRDHSSVIDARNAARAAAGLSMLDSDDDPDLNYSYYHLNSDLTYVDGEGRVMCRLCSVCDTKLKQNAQLEDDNNHQAPRFSIAAGCDFGRPSALNLPELSLLEVQLIACYRVFANLVKLIAPYGLDKSSRQTAFQGHTIVFPHDGPAVCAKKLPNMEGVHDSVAVLFIGTKAQWAAPSTRRTLMQKFQSIFQVRRSAVLLWLKALKRVGNPLYQSLEIALDDDPCWIQMENLANECLNRARIADDAVTLSIEQQSSSDVARVRSALPEHAEAEADTAAMPSAASSSDPAHGRPSSDIELEHVVPAVVSSVFVSNSQPLAIGNLARTGPHFQSDPPNPAPATVASAASHADSRGRLQVLQSLNVAINGPPKTDTKDSHSSTDSGSDPTRPLTVPMTSTTPLNEYGENDILLLGSFPNLFFLGKKLPENGSISLMFRQKLLRQHDQRFSHNHQLLFLLFNQMQRHAVARTVAARVKSSPSQVLAFHTMVNEPTFSQQLEEAVRNPDGPIAEKLTQRVLPMIHIAGATVPFSATERRHALPKLIAYTHQFGLPSFFLTISPSDLDQPLTVRLASVGSSQNRDKSQRVLDFPMPSLSERGRILGKNPVAAAEVFQRLMETVMKTMIGLLPHRAASSSRPPGPLHQREQRLFGVVTSHFFVIETQGRGTLHTHGVIWSDLPPSLLEDIAEHPELVAIVAAALDEVCTACLPPEVHETDDERRKQNVPAKRASLSLSVTPSYSRPIAAEPSSSVSQARRTLLDILPSVQPVGLYCSYSTGALDSTTPFKERWQTVAASVQRHTKHMLTCRKGKSGKYGCRMSIPQALRQDPTGPSQLQDHYDRSGKMTLTTEDEVSPKRQHHLETAEFNGFVHTRDDVLPPRDTRVIMWELTRPSQADGCVVAFNKTLTAALGCNTALYPLGSAQQANATLFYLLKYMTKDSTMLTTSLSALHEARRHIVQYPSVAPDSGQPTRTAQHLLNRVLNNISGKSEVSAEMASAALLGMPSTLASHGTVFCFIWPAIHAARTNRESDRTDRDNEQHQRRSPAIDTEQDPEGSEPTAAIAAPSSNDHDLTLSDERDSEANTLEQVAEEVIEQDFQQAAGVSCPEETIPVYRGGKGNSEPMVVVPQYMHYHFRGEGLKDLCFWEWVALIQVDIARDARDLQEANRPDADGVEADSAEVPIADSDHAALEAHVDAAQNESSRSRSRKIGLAFKFDKSHPMSKTHVQRVRAVQPIPILAGRPAPPYPGLIPVHKHGVKTAERELAARKYAEYMLCLFVPWQLPSEEALATDILGPPLPLTYASFRDLFPTLYHSNDQTLYCRAECIINISHGLRTSYRHKKMLTMWRNRGVLRWGDRGVNTPPGGNRADPDRELRVDYSDDIEVEQNERVAALIEDMRSEARADLQAQLSAEAALMEQEHRLSLQDQYRLTLSELFLSESELAYYHVSRRATDVGGQTNTSGVSDRDREGGSCDSPIQLRRMDAVDEMLRRLKNDTAIEDKREDEEGDAVIDTAVDPSTVGGRSLELSAELDDDMDMAILRNLDADMGADDNADHDAAAVSNGMPHIHLNDQQKAALKQALTWLRKIHEYEQDPSHTAAPEPLRLLIHGGAGVGKSTFARALVMKAVLPSREGAAPKQTVVCAAPTGIAATLLINGRTLHSLLSITPWKRRGEMNASTIIPQMPAVALTIAQARFKNRRILLIDEVSMVGSLMLGVIDARLREVKGNDLPFGGMGIILMGDFFQLQAVADTCLPKAALVCHNTVVAADRAKHVVSLSNTGGMLFRTFHMHRLTQQMRVEQDDVEHTALIESFQRVDRAANPLNRDFIRRLENKYLTPQEVRRDHSWMNATIIVPTNNQRYFLLPNLISHFALRHRRPIIRWRYAIPHARSLESNLVEALYHRFPALTGYFVQGAPIFMTSNLNPNKGMANGTSAVLHSLSWDDDAYVSEVALKVANAEPSEIVDVEIPLSVNAEISISQLKNNGWTRPVEETLVPGRVVIPLESDSDSYIRIAKGASAIKFRQFAYDLAFIVTFHKCQGRTMSKVILDLNQQNGAGCNVTYSSLYVGLSRVRRGNDVRVFPAMHSMMCTNRRQLTQADSPLSYLVQLKPAPELLTWLTGFDQYGLWSESRLMTTAREKRKRETDVQRIQKRARQAVGRDEIPDDAQLELQDAEGHSMPHTSCPNARALRLSARPISRDRAQSIETNQTTSVSSCANMRALQANTNPQLLRL